MTVLKKSTIASLALATSLSALALTGVSHAQVNSQPPATHSAPHAEMRAKMQERMAERRADRAKDLATVLRLRPEQMPALNAFLDSQRGPGRGAQAGGPRQGAPGQRADRGAMTTPERLDRQAERGQQRQARMQARTESLRTFYAALSPDQRQVFDAMTRLRGSEGGPRGGGMGHGGRFGGRMGHGGPPPAAG